MPLTRRDLLASLGGLAAARAFGVGGIGTDAAGELVASMPEPGAAFPRRDDFSIERGYTYLNAAYTHPIPKVSVLAARRAADSRGAMRAPTTTSGTTGQTPRELFARLINAKP